MIRHSFPRFRNSFFAAYKRRIPTGGSPEYHITPYLHFFTKQKQILSSNTVSERTSLPNRIPRYQPTCRSRTTKVSEVVASASESPRIDTVPDLTLGLGYVG
ncbi:Protein of unknown function [Pyronema omphalodes CBS 100304]|uniref:Uncharacterized protein n=1 Tax=Pyronema omphalodes (strain CBS 100304) TaxID=1076935 RepID=U4LQD6_PYROM|nr:Protein of unknown function [Pyronema omphalodes CBS 100304]